MSEQKSALATLAEQKLQQANERMEFVQGIGSGWENLPDSMSRALAFYEMLAICKEQVKLLVKVPHKGRSGEPDWYMSPEQAMVYAMRAYKLDLDPFSGEMWFKPDTWTASPTFDGKKTIASRRSNIGAAKTTEIKRPWAPKAIKPAALSTYEQEPGLRCTIPVGGGEVTYDCWFTEWTTNGGLWLSKPIHMLYIRANEKALSIALGVGASDLPDEREIASEEVPELPTPTVQAKRVEFKAPIIVGNETPLEPLLAASIDQAKNKK